MTYRALSIALLFALATSLPACALIDSFQDPPGDVDPGDLEPGDGELGDLEPGDGEPGDGEPGDGEPGDQEPGDGEPGDGDSEPPPECTGDESRSCDCDLPLPLDGTQTCTADEVFGECLCPTICAEPRDGFVIEGEPCGICQAGLYQCGTDGLATCSEPGSLNACGGCEPTPDVLCTGGSFAVCNSTEQIQCLAATETEITLAQPLDFNRHQALYLFVDDPDASCEGWEIGAAGPSPGAYRQATIENLPTDGQSRLTAQLPNDTSNGILRILIRQNVAPPGDPETILSTHFACGSPEDNLNIYFHPAPLRGPFAATFSPQLPNFVEDPSIAWQIENIGNSSPNPWVLQALKEFGNNPGTLFTGCEQDCGGDPFPSIFENFETLRSGTSWQLSTFSGWNQFYSAWSNLLDDPTFRSNLRDAYRLIFDTYLLDQVYSNLSAYDSWRRGFIYDQQFKFQSLIFHGFRFRQTSFWPTLSLGDAPLSEDPTLQIRSIPLGFCSSISSGMDAYCPPISNWASLDLDDPDLDPRPAPLAPPQYSLDLQQLTYRLSSATPPFGVLLREHLEVRFPAILFPRIIFNADDEPELEYFADLFTLLREIAPCDRVAEAFDELDFDSAEIPAFLTLCEELYGIPADPAEEPLLTRFLNRFPFASPARISYSISNFPDPCPSRLVEDPYHGLRLIQLQDFTCTAPNNFYGGSWGGSFGGTFFPTALRFFENY